MSNLLKVEELRSLVNCRFCSKLFVNPVALPCGISVCESHVAEITRGQCLYCDQTHAKNEYKVNDVLQKMLELEVNSIKLSPKFESCKNHINEAKLVVKQIDQIQKNSDNFIYEHYERFKRQVDLRREELKAEIDTYSDKVIDDITKIQNSQINSKMTNEMNAMNINIETNKKELEDISKQFDTFDTNAEKYENVLKKVKLLKPKLDRIMERITLSLTGNNRYRFSVESISIERIFGTFGGHVSDKYAFIFELVIIFTLITLAFYSILSICMKINK